MNAVPRISSRRSILEGLPGHRRHFQPQDVWKKLVTDGSGERVPATVAANEATRLDAELTALTPGMEVRREPTLLWQIFDDPVFGKDIRAVFAGRDQFTSIFPDEQSFRMRVENWYERTKP